MARIVLILGGGGLLFFGLWGLVDPVGLWSSMGLPVADEPVVRTELRAFYGGFEIGVGSGLLWHLAAERRRNGLVFMALAYGALGLGRGIGLLVDGAVPLVQVGALVTELGFAALAVVALRSRTPVA